MGYILRSGIIGAVISGISLVRAARGGVFTWRTALAWVSWGIAVALAVGAIVDERRVRQGKPVAIDSPAAAKLRESSPKKR